MVVFVYEFVVVVVVFLLALLALLQLAPVGNSMAMVVW